MQEQAQPGKFLLTVVEAGQLLSLSRMSVYRLIQAGTLRSVKIGGARRVSVKAIRAYIAQLEAEDDSKG